MVAGTQKVNDMSGIHDDQDREQRSLPAVLFVLAFCLAAGIVVEEVVIEYLGLKHIWSDCCEWLHWRILPGWLRD